MYSIDEDLSRADRNQTNEAAARAKCERLAREIASGKSGFVIVMGEEKQTVGGLYAEADAVSCNINPMILAGTLMQLIESSPELKKAWVMLQMGKIDDMLSSLLGDDQQQCNA